MTRLSFEGWEPPHLSYSTVSGYRDCGMRTKLQKVLKIEQRPGLAACGGNAVHTATELYDQGEGTDPAELFALGWAAAVEKNKEWSPSFEVGDYTVTGRATAAYGGKQNFQWWMDNGPGMVQNWIDWREKNQWDIWETPEGSPAVELELNIVLPNDIPVKMFLDRVMVTPAGQITVVDIKGLATDTPLATPTGWTTMGAVQVGDEVFGKDGRPCRVTAKSEVKFIDCYRVHFDDKTSIVCDGEHLWETTTVDRNRGPETAVRSIVDIHATLTSGGQANHRVAMPEPLTLPPASLPIDPYVLGAWLGDGNRGRNVITKPDQELFDEIVRRGYQIGVAQIDKKSGCQTRTILGTQATLRAMDQLGNKHVPEVYLRGSVTQRLDLLRGLMDTDGCYNKARRDVRFSVCDKALAAAVEELALSLGERPKTFAVQRRGFGLTVTAYDVVWKPQRFNPFTLPRKRDQVDMTYKSVRSQQRVIQKVEPILSVPTQCIAVDSPDNLYLAGERMVPTHNTGRTPETAEQLGLYATAMELTFGQMYRPAWGYFWDARKGEHSSPLMLDSYTPEYFAEVYAEAVQGMNAGCFLAKPANSCFTWCGVKDHCPAFLASS